MMWPVLLLASCGSPPPLNRQPPRPAASATATPAATRPASPAWVARKVVPDAREVNGQRIHTVKPGETGIAIARAYGVPWTELAALNSLAPPYVIRVGQPLRLPSRQAVEARSVEERARAFTIDMDTLITGAEPASPAAGPPQRTATPAPRPSPRPELPGDAPPFLWPADGRVIAGFGPKPAGRFNDGVNLRVNAGSPVRAAADGTVAYAGDAITGFGNLLLIRHANGWVTAYGHNEALLVTRGQMVKAGEPVARAGSTGAVTEPQLHFEIRRGRVAVDPLTLLPPR
jgi:murein DD-endopeptidase MepM/ murein hydrolase activator NlpD